MSITLDTSQSKRITDYLKRTSNPDFTLANRNISALFISRIRLNFRRSQSPYGETWEKLKHRKGQPLLDTGTLLKSIVHRALPLQLTIGSRLPYAKTHNEGRDAGLFPNAKGYKGFLNAAIPKRQFLPGDKLPKEWEQEAIEVMETYLQGVADAASSD